MKLSSKSALAKEPYGNIVRPGRETLGGLSAKRVKLRVFKVMKRQRTVKIEPGIPLKQQWLDVCNAMEIGDSVLCPPVGLTGSNRYVSYLHRLLLSKGKKAKSVREGNKVRTWRIE